MSGNIIVALFFGVPFGVVGFAGLICHAVAHGGARACNHAGFVECRLLLVEGGDQ